MLLFDISMVYFFAMMQVYWSVLSDLVITRCGPRLQRETGSDLTTFPRRFLFQARGHNMLTGTISPIAEK
jgi:hypothetical protein